MNKRNKLVLVLLDAFRGDYISEKNTPFLHALASKNIYYQKLVPSFGFCERTEILVGLQPIQSGCFTAFGFNPSKSPYKKYINLLNYLDIIERFFNSKFFSKIIRKVLWLYFKNTPSAFFPFNIPLSMLPKLSLTEDGYLNHIENNSSSIYKISNNVFYGSSTSMSEYLHGDDCYRLNQVIENIDSDLEFFPIYISELDVVGHAYGPESPEVISSLRKTDNLLRNFHDKLLSFPENITIVFCGDHGMSKVSKKINLIESIEEFKKKLPKESKFEYFVDSTMSRFWFGDLKTNEINLLRETIMSKHSNSGFFIDRHQYIDNGIPSLDEYGDLMFICNEGVIISPDFFNPRDKSISGMHGYMPKNDSHFGFGIISKPNNESAYFNEELPLSEMYKFLRGFFKQ